MNVMIINFYVNVQNDFGKFHHFENKQKSFFRFHQKKNRTFRKTWRTLFEHNQKKNCQENFLSKFLFPEKFLLIKKN